MKNQIKSYLSLKGYTIEKLAREIGMSTASLSAKINGKREFTVSEAKRLCDSLDIHNPADVFFA